AGSSAGRLLATWGHRVVLLNGSHRSGTPNRGLTESLPPSSRKLLAQIGVLENVERAGFYRSTGNTVWWASREERVETFGRDATGFQVHRAELDRVLLEAASAAGVDVRTGARVRAVDMSEGSVGVDYEREGRRWRVSCQWVIDCSGRAGVLARRFRIPGTRMY